MSIRCIALVSACLLLTGALSAQTARHSNVEGKPCPELLLEDWMIQGPRIEQKDFSGRVVLLLFYMRDCEGCELHAMPRLQQIYERYEASKCMIVMAINTAFDKEFKPYTADADETRSHLRLKRWTMPVARDRDEQSYELFEIDRESGTPQAVVLNENGVVIDHDWFSTKEEMDGIERSVDTAFGRLNCDCIRKPRKVGQACQRAYDAICNGDYSKAWKEADAITSHRRDGDADKKDAEYIKEYVTEIARDQITKIRDSFDYDPVAAISDAETMIGKFRGVTGVSDFETVTGTWRDSDSVKRFRAVREEYEKIDTELANNGSAMTPEEKEKVVERLGEIMTKAEGTSIADHARERVSSLNRESTTSGNSVGGSKNSDGGEAEKRKVKQRESNRAVSRNGRTTRHGSERSK